MEDTDMNKITVDIGRRLGKIKPLHCVNNGPACQSNSNLEDTNFYLYKELNIPYARNHDASFYAQYGLNHTVDVNMIFPCFDADENDPASYDFTCTDDYIKMTEAAGTHHFYRLGTRIEHEIKKYGTVMPPDFHKWARICEHIIMHYTEGWADGFHYDMPYWEIWNEPDLNADDAANKRCWSGTAKDFYELFNVALVHLKSRFPHLKIGGPAVAKGALDDTWIRGLFDTLGDVKPDFFSWHIYFDRIENMLGKAKRMRDLLDEYGMTECESILNEWNYVRGDCWSGPWRNYAIDVRTGSGIKCSSYTAAAILAAQSSSIDMLMLYDARPSSWCSLFKPYMNNVPLKTYYSLLMFSKLYLAGTELYSETEGDDIYAVAATDDKDSFVMLTHYNDDDSKESKSVELCLDGIDTDATLEIYTLDPEHSMELTHTERVSAGSKLMMLDLPLYTTLLVKIIK